MKANELMIGDWGFHVRNRIVSGFGVGGQIRVLEIYEHGAQTTDGFVIYEDLYPIPLTAEILEKNGFIYNDLPFVQSWEQFGLSLYKGGNGYRINCGTNINLVIDYVHELQHALRIYGIEYEITL